MTGTTQESGGGEDRVAKIERYVQLAALDQFAGGGIDNAFDDLIGGDDVLGNGWYELTKELWPEEDGIDSDEHSIAFARSMLLAAQLFERAAEVGAEEAIRSRDIAAKELAKLGRGEPVAVAS